MKKFLVLSLTALLLCLTAFTGCSANSVRFLVPDGGTLLPMAKLLYDNKDMGGLKLEGEIVSGVAVEARLYAGTCEAAIAPVNLCANVYNADKSYAVAGVAVWGNSFIVSADKNITIESLGDLKGKVLCAWGEKAVPGLTLKAVLSRHGIKYQTIVSNNPTIAADTVYLKFFADGPSIRQEINKGNEDFAMLPEPLATDIELAGQAEVVLDIQELYDPLYSYPQACLIVKTAWAQKNPEALDSLLEAAETSAEYCLQNPADTASLAKNELQSADLPSVNSLSAYISGRGQNVMRFKTTDEQATRTAILDYLGVIMGQAAPDDGFFL